PVTVPSTRRPRPARRKKVTSNPSRASWWCQAAAAGGSTKLIEVPCGSSGPGADMNDGDDPGLEQHAACHRAQPHAGEAGASAAADDDEAGVGALRGQRLDRVPADLAHVDDDVRV